MPKIAGSFANAAPGNNTDEEGRKAFYAQTEKAAAALNSRPKDERGDDMRDELPGDRQRQEVARARLFAGRRDDKTALAFGNAGLGAGPTS